MSAPVLIGRDREYRALVEAARTTPAVVLVEGEAGVGKSRLVRDVLAGEELGERARLVGHCHPVRSRFPLGPLVEALRRVGSGALVGPVDAVAGSVRGLIPELTAWLPPLPEPPQDPHSRQHQVFRGLRAIVQALGRVVLVLEDLHWADDATNDVVQFLARDPPAGLALVLTYRRLDLPATSPVPALPARVAPHVTRQALTLAPLDRDGVAALVAAILGASEVSSEFATYLLDRTGGIPFAVEEVLRLLQEREDLVRTARGWERRELGRLGVPPIIRNSILARVANLGGDARAVVSAVAVIGAAADEGLLGATCGVPQPDLTAALGECLRSALLLHDDERRVSFRHVLAREAVYEAIPATQRRALHLRAARAIERYGEPLPVLEVVHHYRAADEPGRWTRHVERAARTASAAGDHRAACGHLVAALGWDPLPWRARVRVARQLGDAALHASLHEPAIDLLGQVVADPRLGPYERGELRFARARLLCDSGRMEEGRRELAASAAELGDAILAARAMINLAHVDGFSPVPDHTAWIERAAAACAGHDGSVRTAVAMNGCAVRISLGDGAGWSGLRDASAGATVGLERLRGNHNLAFAAATVGHHEAARGFLAAARADQASLAVDRWVPWLDTVEVLIDWATGRWEGLRERAERLERATSSVPGRAICNRLVAGALALSEGELDAARDVLGRVVKDARGAEAGSVLLAATAPLVRLLLESGDGPAAHAVATHAREVVGTGVWAWAGTAAPAIVAASVAVGDVPGAAAFVDRFQRGLRGRVAPAAGAGLTCAQAELARADGRVEQAAHLFALAAEEWDGLPQPYEAALARERCGDCVAAVTREYGTAMLCRALADYARLGAAWDAARVRRRFRAHGLVLPYPWRGGRRSYGDRLSPREAEVVRLAAEGLTNREIGAVLYISRRTVDDHVAAAIRKLGVRRKADLVGWQPPATAPASS